MANETNSSQEAVLKELAEHSFAAPFVFAPDICQRYKSEPADLVWACNNCIILMYMTERMEHADPDKRGKVRQSAINHNLSQGQQWLKSWRRGSDIRGANAYHTFSLTFDPKCHIIVLSIIKCGDAIAEFHDDRAKKLGVVCCATLPQSAIEYVVTSGGTALDILIILDYLRKKWGAGPIHETDVLNMAFTYNRAMRKAADVERHWPGDAPDDRFVEAANLLLFARWRKPRDGPVRPSVDWIGLRDLWDVFNDINIGEFLRLVGVARDGLDRTRNDPEHLAVIEVPINTYVFKMLFVFDLTQGVEQQIREIVDDWNERTRAGGIKYGPAYVVDTNSNTFYVLLEKRQDWSQTEALLVAWAARGDGTENCPP